MSDLCYWVGFNLVPGVGPARLRALLAYFGDLAPAWEASATALRAAQMPPATVEQILYAHQHLDLPAEMAKLTSLGVQVLTWESPEYPARLAQIEQAPPVLYAKGDIAPTDEWAVALVGTRSPTTYGKEATQRLAYALAQNDITVVSGLALGIDAVAHQAALEAGGRTLAVLGCGLDEVYPMRHRELAERIIRQGALLTDYPLGTRPQASNFPPRNRIISGLTLGTLVIEAGERSGALITLQFALEQGRETFAVPGSIFSRMSAGTNAAIRRGEAKLVTCVEDILEELNLTMVSQQREARDILPETPLEETLLTCLGPEPLHIDAIVRQCGLATATVSSTLAMMELKGMVRRVDHTSYVTRF